MKFGNNSDSRGLEERMRYLSLERMLLSTPQDAVLRAAVNLSASVSPLSLPLAWVELLLDLRKKHPAFPRVRWDDFPHLLRECWLLVSLDRDASATLPPPEALEMGWDNGQPVWSCTPPPPLTELYALGLMGVDTGHAKWALEQQFTEGESLAAFEAALAWIARIAPEEAITRHVLDARAYLGRALS